MKRFADPLVIILFLILLPGTTKSLVQVDIEVEDIKTVIENESHKEYGEASWYNYFIGDWWSGDHFVCATRDFERYSFVKVTNLDNNKSVECKVTDYGPSKEEFPERIIDLSSKVFNAISDTRLGVIKNVEVEQL